MNNAEKDFVHSDESKEKMSKSQKGKHSGDKNPMYGKDLYGIWLEKYGKDTADKLYEKWKKKLARLVKVQRFLRKGEKI